MGKKVNRKESAPLTHLGHQAKQILTVISTYPKIRISDIQIQSEIPPYTNKIFILDTIGYQSNLPKV